MKSHIDKKNATRRRREEDEMLWVIMMNPPTGRLLYPYRSGENGEMGKKLD